MTVIDWVIIIAALCILTASAIITQRYSKTVSSFLAAERCGGRYMISISSGMAGLGVITLMFMFQISYDTGFSDSWWKVAWWPLQLVFALSGWVIFRFRQTRAMTLAEFFEIRYSRRLRVFAGFVAFIAGILNFGIFPSVGARFFMFFCGLPYSFHVPGTELYLQTFPVLMFILLFFSVLFTFIGGQITIMFTDFIQGLFTTIAFGLVVAFLFFTFSKAEMSETLLAAPPGHSLVNPYDIGKDANFSPVFYLLGLATSFYTVMGWQGTAGYNCCAKTAHEAKMATMLGNWRMLAMLPVLCAFLPISVHIYTKHHNYSEKAVEVNAILDHRVNMELNKMAQNTSVRKDELKLLADLSPAESEKLLRLQDYKVEDVDISIYSGIPAVSDKTPLEAKKLSQLLYDKSDEIKSQVRLPLVIGRIIPRGLAGLFCAAMFAAFISTHNTYLHSWGSMLIQDVVLPFRKKPLSERSHIRLLRLAVIGVAIYAFMFSLLFTHSQRITMYCQITATVFVGGAGSLIIGGLYWKKGTIQAAWVAMIAGLVLALLGIFITQSGASAVDSAMEMPFWISVTGLLAKINLDESFWRLAHTIFKMNAAVVMFLTCYTCMALYAIVSIFTCKKDFNLDKMLHRGKYSIEGDESASIIDAKTIWNRLGFSQDFTKGDYFIAIVSIVWPLVWFIVFIAGTIMQDSIKDTQWFEYWYYWLWGMFVLGIILAVWFTWGGFKDMFSFIKHLKGVKTKAELGLLEQDNGEHFDES